jgi:hypothetical protein
MEPCLSYYTFKLSYVGINIAFLSILIPSSSSAWAFSCPSMSAYCWLNDSSMLSHSHLSLVGCWFHVIWSLNHPFIDLIHSFTSGP